MAALEPVGTCGALSDPADTLGAGQGTYKPPELKARPFIPADVWQSLEHKGTHSRGLLPELPEYAPENIKAHTQTAERSRV